MIKEFFAKLTNWNPYKHQKWENDMANKGHEVSRLAEGLVRERELAKEHEEMRKHSMRADGIIPRIDTDRPSDSREKHDQAA